MTPLASRKAAPAIRRPYCLHCYAPLPRNDQALVHCDHCGHGTVRSAHATYWTREPKLIETEWLAKVGVLVFVGAVSLWMLSSLDGALQLGTGQGWAVGFPILVGALLWETAGKVTRHQAYLNASLLWSALPMAASVIVLALMIFDRPTHAVGWSLGLLAALLCLGLGLLLRFLGRRFGRWKEARIRAGQTRALQSTQAD